MSRKEREAVLNYMPPLLQKRSIIATIDKECDLYDIAIITRASPAKALGISRMKGHLGIGADADISIYDLSPENLAPNSVVKAFSNAAYTIKSGKIVVKEGSVVQEIQGQIMWSDTEAYAEHERVVLEDLQLLFNRFYSLGLDTYRVYENYINNGRKIFPSIKK